MMILRLLVDFLKILFNRFSSLNGQWGVCFVISFWKMKPVGICALQKGIKLALRGKGGACIHMYASICM